MTMKIAAMPIIVAQVEETHLTFSISVQKYLFLNLVDLIWQKIFELKNFGMKLECRLFGYRVLLYHKRCYAYLVLYWGHSLCAPRGEEIVPDLQTAR